MRPKFIITSLAVLALFFVFAARAQSDGVEIYKKTCLKCHGPQGKGDGPAAKLLKNVPMGDLTDQEAMAKYSDEDLYKLIAKGGKALGKSKVMPAYEGKLNDAGIKALISYIKTLPQ